MPDFPNLRIFFLTVGESTAFKSLAAIKAHTKQPYKLTIWYDACGRGVDLDFYTQLMRYSDDVVVLTENHGTTGALAYALLYLEGDYILLALADTVVQEGYLDRFAFAFSRMDKIACAGSFRVEDVPWDFVVNSKDFMPDGVQLFSRKAIDDVGGVAACFKGMGMENLEWHNRAIAKGWNVVTCKGIMKEIGSTHDGRSQNKNLKAEIEASIAKYLLILDSGWEKFKWWAKETA